MRYVGQSYELEVPFPEGRGDITKSTIQDVVQRFHGIHQNKYQHSAPDSPTEFIAFRVVFSQKPRPIPVFKGATTGAEASPKVLRKAYFDECKCYIDTHIYERTTLSLGQRIVGPAIVEQADTTTVIYPDLKAEVDRWGNLILTRV